MFATLPDFTPRDSHSLWYTSSRAPTPILGGLAAHGPASQHHPNHGHGHGPDGSHQRQPRGGQVLLERTALARLAADEAHLQRRRAGVQNYGSTWLKPPGLPKTLHQMREEKREQEEHHEAMRREQLAQELADAEAEAAAAAGAGAEGGGDDDAMDDVQLDGAQDLDEDIPDADDEFALGGGSDSDSEEEEEEDEEEEEEEEYPEAADVSAAEEAQREERRNDLMAARMRMTDDAFREALVRGDPDADDMYGGGLAEELDAEDRGHMLDEDDLVPSSLLHGDDADDDDDVDLGMDANLDDDIPEAAGGYEHTDSDAALSSDYQDNHHRESSEEEDEDEDVGFAPRAAPLMGPPQSPTLRGQQHRQQSRYGRSNNNNTAGGGGGPRSSMDLSAFLSQDEESSFMDSSPAQGRRNMRS
ncbi:hypothetical protein V2A60_010434 [Cordyceps javanica]